MRKLPIIALLVTLLVVCIGYLVIPDKDRKAEIAYSQDRLVEIAQTLEVSPSWEEVVEYVDCQILVPDTKKQSIFTKLRSIGEISWYSTGDGQTININFKEPFLDDKFGRIVTRFDENDNLVIKHRSYTLGDPRQEYCPQNLDSNNP